MLSILDGFAVRHGVGARWVANYFREFLFWTHSAQFQILVPLRTHHLPPATGLVWKQYPQCRRPSSTSALSVRRLRY
jgi:hypothetical protein